MFWILQHEDRTTVGSRDISSMQSTSKEIWTTQLVKYMTMVSHWTAITLAQQKEFCAQIEAEYPFLWLCKDHYKAQKIRVFNYRQWYQKCKVDKKAEGKGKRCKMEPTQDTVEDTLGTHMHLRCTPSASLSCQMLHMLSRAMSSSQISGGSGDHADTSLSAPPPPCSDMGTAPVSSLSTRSNPPMMCANSLPLVTSYLPSSGSPSDTHPRPQFSNNVPIIDEGSKSPMLDKGSPCSSGLNKSLGNHSDAAPTSAACQPDDFVRFFLLHTITTFLPHYHPLKTIPNPLWVPTCPFVCHSARYQSGTITQNTSMPPLLQPKDICSVSAVNGEWYLSLGNSMFDSDWHCIPPPLDNGAITPSAGPVLKVLDNHKPKEVPI